jgi:hypothetical protein
LDCNNQISPSSSLAWQPSTKIIFRFCFLYLLLYCLPGSGVCSFLNGLPWIGDIIPKTASLPWQWVNHSVAVHIFHRNGPETTPHSTGSGDTLLNYIQVLVDAVIALGGTFVWTALDRRRREYQVLYAWLRLLVRFSLAFTMLLYGFAKIIPTQFGPPGLNRLMETYGASSPMGLLWTFMGASPVYTQFTGLVETIAGLLLLFRPTALLGSLICIGVTLNIVLLNFCYDVPVKLFSTHLLLMSIFLTIPYWPALWRFFILHQPAEPIGVWTPPFTRRWLRNTARVLQVVVILSALCGDIWGSFKNFLMMPQDKPAKSFMLTSRGFHWISEDPYNH